MEYTRTIILIVLLVLIIGSVILFAVLDGKARVLAEAHSRRLAGLKKLNSQYHFDMSIRYKYDYYVKLPNKRSFDAFEPYSYYGGLVTEDKQNYELLFRNLENNKQLQTQYYNDLNSLPREIPREVCEKHTRVPYALINKQEKKLVNDAILRPVIESYAVFHVSYISPKGRKGYSKSFSCPISQLSQNYNQHVVTKDMRAFQRSLMTDSLRYDVMKRDGFRCVLCGRTANDGVKLHVDHILPVAKGGKTEMSNLRTLCEYCNLGKSAKYDPNGLN